MACGGESNQEVAQAVHTDGPAAAQNNQANTADPVNVVTGAFTHSEQDVSLPCQRLRLALVRHYNNQLHDPLADKRYQPFGPGWTYSLGLRIERGEAGNVVYIDDRGTRLIFRPSDVDGAFAPPPGSLGMRLSPTEWGGWQLQQIDGLTAEFDAAGRIVALFQPGLRRDSRLEFHYDELGRLLSVNGAGGRELNFRYAGDDYLIRSVSDHQGRRWEYRYNRHGELEEVRDPARRLRRYEYDGWTGEVAAGRKACETISVRAMKRVFDYTTANAPDPPLALVTNHYTTERRVFLQLDALGHPTRFEYNPFTRTTAVTDPAGYSTLYCFDRAGSTTKVRRPEGGVQEFIYDERRNLLAKVDERGFRTEYVDLKEPSRFEQQFALGRRTVGNRADYLSFTAEDILLGYDHDGNPPFVRDALGNVTRFEDYTDFGRPRRVTLPDGSVIQTEYDVRSGLPLRRSRELRLDSRQILRFVQSWDYDDYGNCTRVETWAEDLNGQPATPVRIEALEFDEPGLSLLRARSWTEEKGEGEDFADEMLFKWDALGRLVERTELYKHNPGAPPEARITRFGYDLLDRQVWELKPDGSARCQIYDLQGRVSESYRISSAQPENLLHAPLEQRQHRHRWRYDAVGRVISHIDPTGVATKQEWDSCGRCMARYDPTGALTTFGYDRDGRLVRESTSTGYEITTRFDATSNAIERRDNLGTLVKFERDALGRITGVTRDPHTARTNYRYDLLGRLSEIEFPDATFERIAHNEFDQPLWRERGSVGTAAETTEIYRYDGLGRPVAIEFGQPGALITQFRFEYDDARRELRSYDALGHLTRSIFGSDGQIVRRLDAEGRSLLYAYDSLGRLIQRRSPDGNVESRYTYAADDERLSSASEDDVHYRWEYDAAGRLLSHQQEISKTSVTIRYRYDDAGRLSEKRIGDDWWMKYQYDGAALPSQIRLPGQDVRLSYDPAGRITEQSWPLGGRSRYEYESDGSLCTLESWDDAGRLIFAQTFERDARLRPAIEKRRIGQNETTYRYHYDFLNQLAQVDRGRAEALAEFRRYVYDARGNRLEEHRNGAIHAKSRYDEANRLIEITGADGSQSACEYDGCGNLIRRGTLRFDYDAAGRIRQSVNTENSLGSTYAYSATDQRVGQSRSGQPERIIHDQAQQILLLNGRGSAQAFWWLDLDWLLAAGKPMQPLRALVDSLGSVLATGEREGLLEYDPFGSLISQSEALPGFGFSGKRWLSDICLYDNRARFYDPAVGRFTQPDPLGSIDGLNLFLYARNNPLSYLDPLGLAVSAASQGNLAAFTANLSPETQAFFVGPATTFAYIGQFEFAPVYVGITVNLQARASQHGPKYHSLSPLTLSPMTRGQARAIEQAVIEISRQNNLEFQNIRNSISPTHAYYSEAVAWGRAWLGANDFSFSSNR